MSKSSKKSYSRKDEALVHVDLTLAVDLNQLDIYPEFMPESKLKSKIAKELIELLYLSNSALIPVTCEVNVSKKINSKSIKIKDASRLRSN